MPDDALARLLSPRSIAIVGASSDPKKTAGRPLRYLRKHGFAGRLMPVNPTATSIDGVACYPDIAALPETPDAAIVLLDVARTERAVEQLAARGTPAAIILNGGYGETGPDGASRQQALKRAAGAMRLLGPNTIGLVNVTERIALSASTALEVELQSGGLALISQSGGVMGSILSRAVAKGVGFSSMIATGNEADLEAADFIAFCADDPHTKVIALYLETIRDVDRFRQAAARAARAGKPIVAFKVGQSEAGALSAASHTGALAGADTHYDALFRQTGVTRLRRFSDLLDVAPALATGRRLAGKRLGILTTTGGAGALVADACGVLGFTAPPPDTETAARLGRLMIGDGAVPDRNPIDLTLTGLKPEIMTGAIETLMGSASYDGVVVIVGSSGLDNPNLVADAAQTAVDRHDTPLAIYVSPSAPHILQALNRRGIAAFDTPEGCAAALAALAKPPFNAPNTPPASAVDLSGLATGLLDERASKQLFARFGIPSVREATARDAAEAEDAARAMGGLVVLKIRSAFVAHKSDIGGVMVGVDTADVARCGAQMRARAQAAGVATDGFLVQEQIVGATEMILGVVRDPRLGPAILLGWGGVHAELIADTALRLAPLTARDARDMIASLRMKPLLDGYRGAAARDVPALIDAVVAFSRMVAALGDRLAEAEINPLFVLPEGQGVRAADGLVRLA